METCNLCTSGSMIWPTACGRMFCSEATAFAGWCVALAPASDFAHNDAAHKSVLLTEMFHKYITEQVNRIFVCLLY